MLIGGRRGMVNYPGNFVLGVDSVYIFDVA